MKNSVLFVNKAYRHVVSSLINMFSRQTNYDIDNTILIIGSTRSGTTFLMESINQKNDYRLIFEPFNNTYTSEWNEFSTREYVHPSSKENSKNIAIEKILTGKISNSWVNRYNRKLISEKRLVKAVRANLLVEYIRSKYPKLLMIYLVRNPYDVVASRINMNFNAQDVYQILEKNEFLNEHYSDINIETLNKLLESKEAKHAALWCLENRYLLRLNKKLDLHILHYEDIIGKSIFIEDDLIKSIEKESIPSASSSFRKSYKLNTEEKINIKQVLDLFGISY